MKFRNTIKKIAALGVGATMLGTTMMGALAADLSNYPNMFMQDNKFNAVLVVGSQAAPIDIVGAIDMAYSLQAAATETTDVSIAGTTTVTTTSGVEVAASGNHLNLKEVHWLFLLLPFHFLLLFQHI
jgi:S-layer protein (TIGR01564 family)